MLYASIHPTIVHQGDILSDCFFTALDSDTKIVETSLSGTEIKESPDSVLFSSESKKLVTNFKKSLGIVITQTCDIQRRDFIQICPVFSLESLKTEISKSWDANRVNNHLGQLKNGKLGYYFYLPEVTLDDYHLDESCIDLQLVTSVRRESILNYPRLVALSDVGRHWLSFSLMSYYGRPFSE